MVEGWKYWSRVGAVFALHLAATLFMSRYRTGFFLFTIPIVVPIAGAESALGRAIWLLAVDAGAVAVVTALARVAQMPQRPRAQEPGVEQHVDAAARAADEHMGSVGHLMSAVGIIAVVGLLVVVRDQAFVLAVSQPTITGTYGVVQVPIFSSGFALYLPWVVLGATVDVLRHLVFAATESVRARLASRTLSRLVTAAVLLMLATAPVFNIGGFMENAPAAAQVIGLAGELGLAGLGIVSAIGALADWLKLYKLLSPPASAAPLP